MLANFEMEGLHVAYNGKTICRVIVQFFLNKTSFIFRSGFRTVGLGGVNMK